MLEQGFSLTRIFPYKNKIFNSGPKLENMGQGNLLSGIFYTMVGMLSFSLTQE